MFMVEGLKYYENYRCWEGAIKAKCSEALFGENELLLRSFIDSQEPISEANYHVLRYVQDHFAEIYETILRTMFEWQSLGMKFEIFDKEKLTFKDIKFNSWEELHPVMGEIILEIVPDYEKDGQSYYCIRFDHCLLSIEHGFTALCHRKEVIDIESCEIISMLEMLSHFEHDCTKWVKDFWRVKLQLKADLYRNKDAARELWLVK
jgi:hypothetical protein